jgi:predicted transcriptional regulator
LPNFKTINGTQSLDDYALTKGQHRMAEQETIEKGELLALTSEIVSSHVANNTVEPTQLPDLIQTVFAKLSSLANEDENAHVELTPAVSIRKSVTDDFIICLEDGKKLKMLKRHLMTSYGLTPEEYRAKWGLKPDYPMVAPNYAKKRQELAKKIGLGRKPGKLAKPAAKPKAKAKAKPKAKARAKK